MERITPRIRGILFGCAIAGTLAFGATQAVATPAEDSTPRACSSVCAPECGSFGGELRHFQCLCCG
jgi:hypothetical protein